MNNFTEIFLEIDGMSCAACSSSIQRALKRKDFIKEVEVFLISNKAKIVFDSQKAGLADIIQLIEKIGYGARLESKNEHKDSKSVNINEGINKIDLGGENVQKNSKNSILNFINFLEFKMLTPKRRLLISIILTLIILYISMLSHILDLPLFILQDIRLNALLQCFISLIVAHMGRDFYIKGLKSLFKLSPNMDTLVALGSMAGFFYSSYFLVFKFNSIEAANLYYEGVCVIITFIMIGKYIEGNAKSAALKNAQKLLKSNESKVLKVLDFKNIGPEIESTKEEEIDFQEVKVGDVIKILPFQYVPSDGVVLSQYANIDESYLSGEALPVFKQKGERVFGGSINTDQSLIIRVDRSLEDSTMAKIQNLVQNALSSRARISSIADSISSFFVPIVMILALVSGGVWYFLEGLEMAMLTFASTLLISCPCALGLATPLAILFANAKSNKFGIFFKNSNALENASRAKNIFFDKTGTLTSGELKLRDIISFDNVDASQIYKIIKSVEMNSEHIIAKAIKAHKDIEVFQIKEYENIVGMGIKARLENDDLESDSTECSSDFRHGKILVGSINLFNEELQKRYKYILDKENIVVFLGFESDKEVSGFKESKNSFSNQIMLGAITLIDNLKADSLQSIQKLKDMGFNIKILSGDNEKSVKKIAHILDIDYRSNCTPQDKLEEIQNKKDSIMVGDGTNDAAALAHSFVSISMGHGSHLSIENSDIIIFNERLDSIINAIELSRKTLRNIKQSLSFAFIYNIICIPIAMGLFASFGLSLNPMYAAIAMSLSSISVVLNASRIYYE